MDSNLSYYVELAMQGDPSALEEIYKQTYWTVYYTCFSFLKNEQDAADTTQEVYVTVMNSLSTLQDKNKFLYWLNRIAVNKCKNILAQNNPVTVDMDVAENVILEENENFLPEDYITNQEKRQLVMNIIRTCLNESQYQTVFLHYFNGFSVSEIAEIMECPVGTVTYRLSVARGKIKQAVTQYENISNEKLYSVGAIPLLACLFSEEFRSLYHVSPTPANIFNSVSTNTLAKAVAKKGADGMLKTAKAKIIASAAGIIIVGGIAAAIITGTRNKEKDPTTAGSITTEGTFTTEAAESTVEPEHKGDQVSTDDSGQSGDALSDENTSANTQSTEDGFCGLKNSYKDDYKATFGDIIYGTNDINSAELKLDGIETSVNDILSACIEDGNLKGYDPWLDLYISDRKDIGSVNIAAGEKEKSVKFYKEAGDFSAAITLYFANYTDGDLPLSECTLKGAEVTDAVDLVFDDTIRLGSNIEDMISLYGTAYNAGGLSMSYKWANDECEYEINAYVDNDNKITKFEWYR